MLEYQATDVPPPGYELSGPDNNATMFDRGDRSGRCASCGRLMDTTAINPAFTLDADDGELIDYGMGAVESTAAGQDAKRIFDFSFTYDLFGIASRRFRDAVEQHSSTAVTFVALPREPNFFVVRPEREVQVDVERSGITFQPSCPTCGEPQGAHGGVSRLRTPELLDPHGMYRTDVGLGDVHSLRTGVLLVGPELAHHLRPLNGVILYHPLRW